MVPPDDPMLHARHDMSTGREPTKPTPAVVIDRGAAGKASMAAAGWTIVSRVTGFARAATVAAVLGATYLGNTYQAINQFPNLAFGLLTGGLFGTLLVPSLVRQLDAGDREGAAQLAGGFMAHRHAGSTGRRCCRRRRESTHSGGAVDRRGQRRGRRRATPRRIAPPGPRHAAGRALCDRRHGHCRAPRPWKVRARGSRPGPREPRDHRDVGSLGRGVRGWDIARERHDIGGPRARDRIHGLCRTSRVGRGMGRGPGRYAVSVEDGVAARRGEPRSPAHAFQPSLLCAPGGALLGADRRRE